MLGRLNKDNKFELNRGDYKACLQGLRKISLLLSLDLRKGAVFCRESTAYSAE